MTILQWEVDQRTIAERLQNKSKLKLCCKTIDEPDFVRGWVAHHAEIVGHENLIVADNGSTDGTTLEFYEEISDSVTIFQFSGPHNEIHWHPRFSRLFDSIKSTSDFFSFIDVDERLIRSDGTSWSAEKEITDILNEPDVIYPTTWLINALGRFDRFTLTDTEGKRGLVNNLRWGKPILPAQLVASQTGIHNSQFIGHEFSLNVGTSLFLLHYTQFPLQRIRANMKKLHGRGLVERNAEPATVPGLDFSSHPDKTVLRFQREIVDMLSLKESDFVSTENETGYLELAPGGLIHFSDEKVRVEFETYLSSGSEAVRSIRGL